MKSKKKSSFSLIPLLVFLIGITLIILGVLLFQQIKPTVLGTTDTATTSVSASNKELYVPL
jgi:hypothetical protein